MPLDTVSRSIAVYAGAYSFSNWRGAHETSLEGEDFGNIVNYNILATLELFMKMASGNHKILVKYNKFTTNNMIKTLDQSFYWNILS